MDAPGGSLPPRAPPDLYARAGRIARAGRSKLLLDTSGAAVEGGARSDWRVLSDEPAWIRACTALVNDQRVEIVALTLGHRGAMLVTRHRVIRAETPPITVSSFGAGDSFLVWALPLDHPPCSNPGTESVHPEIRGALSTL